MSTDNGRGPVKLGARVAPLSFAQERLWLIDTTAPGWPAYNVPLLMRWFEAVDVDAWQAALTAVVTRHAVLRTTYELRDGSPVQVVGDPHEVAVDVIEVDSWAEAQAQARRVASQPFDLAASPPLRCVVWQGILGGDAVLLSIHHIAVDGWSLATLLDDLAQAYETALAGGVPELPDLAVQYSDFAVWDRQMFDDPTLRGQVVDRAEELLAVPSPLRLGGAHPAPATPEGARSGQQHLFDIPAAVFAAVGQVARKTRTTPFVVLLAAFTEVLRRWSGRPEFIVGTVTANRDHPLLENLVGFFVNTVPLRCSTGAGLSFAQLCLRTRAEAFKSLTYQRIPFDQLTAAAAARSLGGHSALVNIGFALQNMPPPNQPTPPRWAPPTLLPTGTAKFEVLLIVDETPGGARGTLEYDTDLYSAEFGERFAQDYMELLTAAVADPDRPLDDLLIPHGPLEPPEPVVDEIRTIRERTGELTQDERNAADLFNATLSKVDGRSSRKLGRDASFFALGGHSLLAVTMLAEAQRRHGVEVRPRDFLRDPTVSGLATLLAARQCLPGAPAGPATDVHSATSVQQRFWFLDRIPELRAAYLVPAVVELTGLVDTTALGRAVDEVLARHPALRSRFRLDRESLQVVYRTDGSPARVSVTDARAWGNDKVADHVAELCWTPFNLAEDVPVRAEIVLLPERCLLVLCAHHIVVDGWSQQVLLDQVAGSYRGTVPLPEPVHPARFATGESAGDRIDEVVAALSGAPTDVHLPHDRPRGAMQSIAGATVSASLGAALASRLRSVAQSSGCSTFMIMTALVAVTLARRSGQRDFLFVFPWMGRDDPSSSDAVGMFVNTVPIRIDLRGEPTWYEVLERVRAASTAGYRNADLPFDTIAATVHPDRDLSRPAVSPVYIAASDGEPVPPEFGPGVVARYQPLDPLAVKYELEFTAIESGGDIKVAVSYLTDLFDESTVVNQVDSLVSIAAELAGNAKAPACEGKPR